jgi:hypothetical protein
LELTTAASSTNVPFSGSPSLRPTLPELLSAASTVRVVCRPGKNKIASASNAAHVSATMVARLTSLRPRMSSKNLLDVARGRREKNIVCRWSPHRMF